MKMVDTDDPLFTAATSSARQLYIVLKCINFSSKVLVQVTRDGLRFVAEDSSTMEGIAFLESKLFNYYTLNMPMPSPSSSSPQADALPLFSISLASLLSILQLLGTTDPFTHNTYPRRDAFSAAALGLSGVCRLRYVAHGAPLEVSLEEPGFTTTCSLVTYDSDDVYDIPFTRDRIALKVIMPAHNLHDAIAELAMPTPSPERIVVAASEARGLILATVSAFGATAVQFKQSSTLPSRNDADAADSPPCLLETFKVHEEGFRQSYKFAHVIAARRALAAATKVSVRGDEQGVLSLQFMIEIGDGPRRLSFVDFRLVPMVMDGEEVDLDLDGDDVDEMAGVSGDESDEL